MRGKYITVTSLLLVLILTIAVFSVIPTPHRGSKKYLEKHNFPFKIESRGESAFRKVEPTKFRTLATSDYKTYDEQGVYELEWSVAPGGILKAIVKAEFSSGLGYVSIEGNKIRAYNGSSLTSLAWERVDEGAIYLISSDTDGDGYTEIGVLARDRAYVLDDGGTYMGPATPTLSSQVLGSALGGASINGKFVVVTSTGQVIIWDSKTDPTIQQIGAVSKVAFAADYIFVASGNVLKVYDLSLALVAETSFADNIASIDARAFSSTYVAVAAGREVTLLSFDGSSFLSYWSSYLPKSPKFVKLMENANSINVYVALTDEIIRIIYGFEVNSVNVPASIDGMLVDDANGQTPEEIIVYSRSGNVYVYTYDLILSKTASVGEGLRYVIVDGASLRIIMAKDFEVVVGSIILGETNISIDNRRLTGNQFYASLIYSDTNGVKKIVAGGSDGKLYFLSMDGNVLRNIDLGGNITQILLFRQDATKTWFAVNNGSLVFVSDSADIVRSIGDGTTRIEIGVGTFKGAEGVIVLLGTSLYYVAGPEAPTSESISDLTYKDFVIANLDGAGDDDVVGVDDLGKQLVVIRAEYVSGSYVWSDTTTVSVLYNILDVVTLEGATGDKVGMLMLNGTYYVVGVFDGTNVIYSQLDFRNVDGNALLGAMDYNGDNADELSVVEVYNTYSKLIVYEQDLTSMAQYDFSGIVKKIFYVDIDHDTPDEIVANLDVDSKYIIRILDNNFTVLYEGTIAGTIYSVAELDIDNDRVAELVLSMSGLQYLNRRTVYIQLISPEVPEGIYGIIDWRSYVVVKWKVYSEDPISAVSILVDSKTIATLTSDVNQYNITFSSEGRYTIAVKVTTASGLSCSVAFWYEYNASARNMPVEVRILTPNPDQELQGPVMISGTAKGLSTINVSIKIDDNDTEIRANVKPIGIGKWYWWVEWDPFGLVGTHTITAIATNGTHYAIASIRVRIIKPDIYVWADLDGNPDPAIIGTFLPNVSVPNTLYVRVAWPASSIKGVKFIYNGIEKAATYDSKRNAWYTTLDMGMFQTDTFVSVVVVGTNGNTMRTSVRIEVMELPLWILELVERYTKGIIQFSWDPTEKAYKAQTDVISLLDFLRATGILSKLGINFTIPKEIPVFGEKMTLLNLGVIIGFKLYITKYISMWAKAQLSGQILDKGITVGLYVDGLFSNELELVKLMIDAVFGVTNLATFTYRHIIPFEVAGIPIDVRLGITFSIDAFVHGGATIDGNWSVESFLVDFNPVVKAGAWAYVDVALGLVSVGVIASPTVDIHGIYKYYDDESMWKVSAALVVPYKVVLSLFFDAIKTNVLSGTLGPWTWEKTSDNWRVPGDTSDSVVINMEPFTKTTLLQHADIKSDGDQTLVVWVHGEELAYAVYNGYDWSDVDLITYDGYPKSNPTIVPMNGKWMVIWTQTNYSGDLSSLRLYYSILDNNGWTVPARVTGSNLPEGYPKAVYLDGKVYLVYLVDSDGDLDTKDWTLWYTVFDGRSWSEPKKVTDIAPVVSPDITVYDNNVYITFVTDEDDFTTPEGQKLYLASIDGDLVSIASDTLISSPAISVYGEALKIAWVEATDSSEGAATYTLKVATVVDSNIIDTSVVATGAYKIADPEFVVKDNELRLFWIATEKGADGDIMSAVYRSGEWQIDLEQNDDIALWSQEYTVAGTWMGVLSEPYTIGVHIVSADRQWFLVSDEVPTQGTPEKYTEPSVSNTYTLADTVMYIALGVPFGVIIGLLGALFTLSRRRSFIIAQ